MSRNGTGIGGKLSRFGHSVARALTSSKAQSFYKSVGEAATRFAKSEVGSRVLTGVAQGALGAAVTGENLGQSISKAVVLNISGEDPQPIDPLNSSELAMVRRVEKIEEIQEADEHKLALEAAVEKKQSEQIPKLLKAITDNRKATRTEEKEIELLEKSAEALSALVTHERQSTQKISNALERESIARSKEERDIITTLDAGYERLREAALREKSALIEEAVEQTVEIGSNIAEHAAATIPFIGEGVAAGIATARGAISIYRLGKTISDISGLDVSHIVLPKVSRKFIQSALEGTLPDNRDERIKLALDDKLEHLRESEAEAKHLVSTAIPRIKDTIPKGQQSDAKYPIPRVRFPVASKQLPAVHVYTSAFGSDAVVILHVISPLAVGASFVLMVDLEYEYIKFNDVYIPPTPLHTGPNNTSSLDLAAAVSTFFYEASNMFHHDRHADLIRRSIKEDPFYIGSVKYSGSYTAMRRNANEIASRKKVQMHLLRGPMSYQRTAVLNAVMHGFALPDKGDINAFPGPPP